MNKFLTWLFGPKPGSTKTLDTANTAPLTEQQLQAIVSNQNPRFELQQLVSAASQSVGKQRELNEDSLLSITTTMAGDSGNLPFGLYIVADGMGGHQFGEVASNAAIRTVAGYVLRKFHSYLFFRSRPIPWMNRFRRSCWGQSMRRRNPFSVRRPAVEQP